MFNVCRLVGYAESDIDCYYVVQYPHKDTVEYSSAVGHCMELTSLKNQDATLMDDGRTVTNFDRLDMWLGYNGAPKIDEFINKFINEKSYV
jgi:hypothetical protein